MSYSQTYRPETHYFCLVGQFLGYELKGYKIYRLHLRNERGEYRMKLSSAARDDLLRAALQGNLQVGDWLEVTGKQTFKEGYVKLKVSQVQLTVGPSEERNGLHISGSIPPTQPGPKTQILVCQKSNCCKRGGQAMCQALQQGVEERGLGDRVRIKATGCLKKCGQGPNMIVGTTRYCHVQAENIPQILEKHFSTHETEWVAAQVGSEPKSSQAQLTEPAAPIA